MIRTGEKNRLIFSHGIELICICSGKEKKMLKFLGNLLWFIFGGVIMGLSWTIAGLFWCITIIGIPWGIQCFKFAKLCFFPFGKATAPGLLF